LVGDLIDFNKGTMAVDKGPQRMPWSEITLHNAVTTGGDQPNVVINILMEDKK
jgi:hypothetical protein